MVTSAPIYTTRNQINGGRSRSNKTSLGRRYKYVEIRCSMSASHVADVFFFPEQANLLVFDFHHIHRGRSQVLLNDDQITAALQLDQITGIQAEIDHVAHFT